MDLGYERLARRYRLERKFPFHTSRLTDGLRRTEHLEDQEIDYYLPGYQPEDSDVGHLVFALKYDGVELDLLKGIFEKMDLSSLTLAIQAQPFSKYLRRLWFLCEWLLNCTLPIPNLEQGNYVDLLDADRYFSHFHRRSQRHRVNVNTLFDSHVWCPVIRKSRTLADFIQEHLTARTYAMRDNFDPTLLARAVNYLYTKETRSSFLIEHEEAGPTREARFLDLLERAPGLDNLNKEVLLNLQNVIVDPRFADNDYRENQVYVAAITGYYQNRIHYIAPPAEGVECMMAALLQGTHTLVEGIRAGTLDLDPVVVAALVSFSFVYIHPFNDGNGRLHRFLIHYVLARSGFTPPDLIVPVSAAIWRDPRGYDQALEVYSKPVMRAINYQEDVDGQVTLSPQMSDHYRYPDLTRQAEELYRWVKTAIDEDLWREVKLIERLDRARRRIRDEVVEMPDRLERLFMNLCLQHKGVISKAKRPQFAKLTDDEITRMEAIFQAEVLSEDAR